MNKFIFLIILLLAAYPAYAADQDLRAKTEDIAPTGDDLAYTVNDPAGSAADRKVTLANLAKALTVTNMISSCTNGQVLGGTAGGTGVECQADSDNQTTISGNAGTATALAANGTNCGVAGQFATGVDASGNAEGCAAPTGVGGDVLGPASNTDSYVPQWNGANSKTLKDGLAVDATGDCGASTVCGGGHTHTAYPLSSLYDAQTILYAKTDNTPEALSVSEQTVVGRATGGDVTALSIDADLSSVSASDNTVPSAKATKAMGDAKQATVTEGSLADSTIVSADIKNGEVYGVDLATNTKIVTIAGITVDGGGSAITTGVKGYVTVPYASTITGWDITCDGSSPTVTFDIWKVATGTALPADGNSITSAAQPALSTGNAIHSTTITNWTTAVAAGDIIGFNVDAATVCTKATLVLEGNKT